MSIDWADLASLLVAFTAIVISVKALSHNQRHMRLSLRPWLTGHYMLQTDVELAIEVENRGIGPAIIKQWKFWHTTNDSDFITTGLSSDLEEFIASKLSDSTLRFTYSSKKRDSILVPGEKWRIFELKASNADPGKMGQARDDMKGFCLEIDYQSFYEEDFNEVVSFRRMD